MKYFLVLGGFLGCSLAFASALAAGNGIDIALRNGAIGCLVGAVLLKGFYSVLLASIRASHAETSSRAGDPTPSAPQHPSGKKNGST